MAKPQTRSQQSKSASRAARRRVKAGVSIVAVLVVAGIIAWFAYQAAANKPGEQFADQGNEHIQAATDPHVAYNSDPPTSGPHLPYIAPWGIHTRPVQLELQVHNLEDGGVVINYKPQCADQVQAGLRAIADRYPDHVVLAPYPALDRCIALTAWTRIDKMDELDERRVVRFIDAYRGVDHHPQ